MVSERDIYLLKRNLFIFDENTNAKDKAEKIITMIVRIKWFRVCYYENKLKFIFIGWSRPLTGKIRTRARNHDGLSKEYTGDDRGINSLF